MSDGQWMAYDYDAFGLRVSTIENGNWYDFTLDRGNVIVEKTGENDVTRYIRGIDLIVKTDNGEAPAYYLHNAHGDVVNLVNGGGEVLNRYTYDAFGNTASYSEAVANRFIYAGEQFDKITGEYYLRARYYDPATSRMLTEDSYRGDIRDPQSLNLYTYCSNNPIRYIDPSGNKCIDAVAGWAKSIDDAIFFGLGGWLSNKIRSLFGAEENDWDYLKSNNPDFALAYQAGTYANLIYGFVNIGSGIYKITTSAGEALVTSSGEIVRVNSGTVNGIIQTAQGAGISLASNGNLYVPSPKHNPNSGWGSKDPFYDDASEGQKALDNAYSSSKNKQLYNVKNGKLVKFQPDGNGGWHAYEVQNPAKEVPTDVLRKMLDDGKITKAQYKDFIKNN